MAALPSHRVYSVIQTAQGFELDYSDVAGALSPITLLPDGFGTDPSDTVATLALSPDHRYLAIDAMRDHGDTVWVLTTTNNQLHLTPSDASGNFLHWMPDGEHFLFRPFLPLNVPATWNPGLWIVDAATGAHVDLSLPGNLPATDLVDAAPSPDGGRIVLSVTGGLGSGSSIWLTTPDGLTQQQIAQSPADAGLFAWSPDGTHVAYETIADSAVPFRPAGLWVMSPDGSGQRQIALADGGHGYAPAWSPDGSQVAFVARLNSSTPAADDEAGELVSAVQEASLATGAVTTLADPAQTGMPRNIAPFWLPDGTLTFTAMRASAGYGAAPAPATLWQATPSGNTPGALALTPLGATTTANVYAEVVVP